MSRNYLLVVLPLVCLLAACTALAGLGQNATAESTETQGVDVAGVPTLTVNHFAGAIDVQTGEEGHITAKLTRKSSLSDPAEAEAQLEQIAMSFTQQGTNVTLTIEGPDATPGLVSGPVADLELLVPPGAILALNLGAGDISVAEPQGNLTVNAGSSNMTVTLPADASFRLVLAGGAVMTVSEFTGVPDGGAGVDIDVIIGDSPTQTLRFTTGAGRLNLNKAP